MIKKQSESQDPKRLDFAINAYKDAEKFIASNTSKKATPKNNNK